MYPRYFSLRPPPNKKKRREEATKRRGEEAKMRRSEGAKERSRYFIRNPFSDIPAQNSLFSTCIYALPSFYIPHF
ncbi:hypothetical protein POVCU1_022090 [Plasmodium ovale curtisi]|uniref:Uncharacterized protein n=1 Tax=Plasmodium ovale curtisi TaxID=864141 RepID=A0A1A8WK04_PLAOA|nr:hypothetical protein POVCU1_022090 [Plasmodium ovale curtisi]